MYNASKTARYAICYGASDKTIKRHLAKTFKRMPARWRARLVKEERQALARMVLDRYYMI